jgi:hypothetical protein
MFWIGFAAGTGVCFVICLTAITVIGCNASKAKNEGQERLYKYWEDTDANIKQYVIQMRDVAAAIREHLPL